LAARAAWAKGWAERYALVGGLFGRRAGLESSAV
jgi:hypothetical protein